MCRRSSSAGRAQSMRASSTVIFGATVTPSAGWGVGSRPSATMSIVATSCVAPESASIASTSPAVASGSGRDSML